MRGNETQTDYKQLIILASLKCMYVLTAAVTTSRCPPFPSPLRGLVYITMAIHPVALLFRLSLPLSCAGFLSVLSIEENLCKILKALED